MGGAILFIDLILFIFIMIVYLNLKTFVGKAGEFWTKRELKKLSNEYKTINDVMIKTSDGSTHQIDHIVVSKYGIFVIETKQLNGFLTGNDYDKKWEYKTRKQTHYFKNPVHQNYGHILALKEVLNIEEDKFILIVCITSNTKMNIDSVKVVTIDKLLEKIKLYNVKIIDNEEIIYNMIKSVNITNKKEKKQHIKSMKKLKKQKKIEDKNKCPKCGGYLVGRTGKYGTFTGCSKYPTCNYTRK